MTSRLREEEAMAPPKTDIDLVELEKLCQLQCTDEEIAAWFNVSTRTVERRRLEPEFAEVMARGKAKGRISVRRMQMRLLEQGNATMGVWLGKQLLGQKDQVTTEVRQFPSLLDLPVGERNALLNEYLVAAVGQFPELARELEAVEAQYTVVKPAYAPRTPGCLPQPKDMAAPPRRKHRRTKPAI
jgi:hypothetical protein